MPELPTEPILTIPVLLQVKAEYKFINSLSADQQYWWHNVATPQMKMLMKEYLSDNTIDGTISSDAEAYAVELIDLSIIDGANDAKLLQFCLNAKSEDFIYNEFSDAFLLTQDNLIDADIAAMYSWEMELLRTHFAIKCAVLRFNHPQWSDIRIFWEASKEIIHVALDVFGLVPVVGEIADLTNGLLYTIEGDGLNATLSYASAVPLVGWGSVTTKYGLKIVNAVNDVNSKVKLVWKVAANGLIDFGSSGQLRKTLGLLPGNPFQAHHLIPWATRNHDVIQKASKSGNAFHMNEALNGIAVEAWRNQPNHNNYNNLILTKLNDFINLQNPNATPQECYDFVSDLVQDIRDWVITHPSSHLNELVLP